MGIQMNRRNKMWINKFEGGNYGELEIRIKL